MQILPIMFSGHSVGFSKNSHKNLSNFSLKNNASEDVFVKQTNNISFGEKPKPTVRHKLGEALELAGGGLLVGTPFLLSIAAGIYLAKHANDDNIFLSDGTYLCNVDDFNIKSDKLEMNSSDGICKIKGTGIDIDASKYDYADPDNGIYKNYDGSVDIDLLHNKYIDTTQGILIDPDSKLSVITDGTTTTPIFVPKFGSGYGHCPWDPCTPHGWSGPSYTTEDIERGKSYLTREDYIKKFGVAPENSRFADEIKEHGKILPNKRTFLERVKDFFTGRGEIEHDVFGREIRTYVDPNGKEFRFPVDEKTAEFIKHNSIIPEKIPVLSHMIEESKYNQFLTDNPVYARTFLPANFETFEHFSSGSHVADAVDSADAANISDSADVPDIPDTADIADTADSSTVGSSARKLFEEFTDFINS